VLFRSKTLLGQGKYELNPQTGFDANIIATLPALAVQIDFDLSSATEKDHYITDIFISGLVAIMTIVRFIDRSTGRIFFGTLVGINDPTGSYVHFSVPIKTSCLCRVSLSTPSAANDDYTINIYGWYE
jgi:hypothetical protein